MFSVFVFCVCLLYSMYDFIINNNRGCLKYSGRSRLGAGPRSTNSCYSSRRPVIFFEMDPSLYHPGHIYKLFKKRCYATVRSNFFGERIVNIWNNLPGSVDFSSLTSFVRTVKLADLSDYLRCFFLEMSFTLP